MTEELSDHVEGNQAGSFNRQDEKFVDDFLFLNKLKVPPSKENLPYYFDNLLKSSQFGDLNARYEEYLDYVEQIFKKGSNMRKMMKFHSDRLGLSFLPRCLTHLLSPPNSYSYRQLLAFLCQSLVGFLLTLCQPS